MFIFQFSLANDNVRKRFFLSMLSLALPGFPILHVHDCQFRSLSKFPSPHAHIPKYESVARRAARDRIKVKSDWVQIFFITLRNPYFELKLSQFTTSKNYSFLHSFQFLTWNPTFQEMSPPFWIHCNICSLQFSKDLKIYMLNCSHMLCKNCMNLTGRFQTLPRYVNQLN